MRTVRSTLMGALTKWIDSGDSILGPCVMIKLIHYPEDLPPSRVDSWDTSKGISIAGLANTIEECARNDAANGAKRSIVEEYAILPYFGKEMAEGGRCKFSVAAAINDGDPETSGIGAFTEGATMKGIQHQGMRWLEAMARTFIDGISRNNADRAMMQSEIRTENVALRKQNQDMHNEVEESKDRSVERQLAVYKMYEEEKRTTKLIEGLIPAGMMIANAAIGRPLFPVDSDDSSVNMFKNWIRSLTIKQLEEFQKTLSQEQYMPLIMAKEQLMDEDDKREKQAQDEANRKIQGVMNEEGAMNMIAKKDKAGEPREPLSPPAPEQK